MYCLPVKLKWLQLFCTVMLVLVLRLICLIYLSTNCDALKITVVQYQKCSTCVDALFSNFKI